MPVDMLYPGDSMREHRAWRVHILRRASALPSDIDRAMREASECRTATDTDSYAFFI